MQLKIQRSQRSGLTGKVFFCVDMRAAYSPEERGNINRYALGGQVIYSSKSAQRHLENAVSRLDRTESGSVGERAGSLASGALSLAMAKMSLNMTIASLGRGHHVECKDLGEMLAAEETVRNACKELTRYLEAAATFDGSETVIEYVDGMEQVHIMQNAPPLLEYGAKAPDPAPKATGAAVTDHASYEVSSSAPFFELFTIAWNGFEKKAIAIAPDFGLKINETVVRVAAVIVGLLVLYILVKAL